MIVRIAGGDTIDSLRSVLGRPLPKLVQDGKSGVAACKVIIDDQLSLDAWLYLFTAPRSYTGDSLAEIHIHTNPSVIEALLDKLLGAGLRMAGPGEFTARAYLNGKIDLTQAEAVNEIIISSNRLQIAAAEKLLAGRLAQTTSQIAAELMDCLSLIEAGLDFSGEDIEFITRQEAVEKFTGIKGQLQGLLAGSISDETVIDLPAVGIAGAPNAGKSSLLNKLLGKERSIVSKQRKTTRDVLTAILQLEHCRCVLFDCAGLIFKPETILDQLAQTAAIQSLQKASVIVFCIDIAKQDWAEDIVIGRLIEHESLLAVATKCDLLGKDDLAERLTKLNQLFGLDFLAVSSQTGIGLELLREIIDKKIIELTRPSTETPSQIALTARHKQAVTEAIENITDSIDQIKAGSDEIAAMTLRTAFQAISNIHQHSISEQILENIFSRFCIGK